MGVGLRSGEDGSSSLAGAVEPVSATGVDVVWGQGLELRVGVKFGTARVLGKSVSRFHPLSGFGAAGGACEDGPGAGVTGGIAVEL